MSLATDVLVPLQGANGGGLGAVGLIIYLAIFVAVIAGMWKAFQKAGEPGWAAIIPIYNAYVIIRISDNPWWWLILMFIPLINIFAFAKISIDVADQFGQSLLFGLGLWILGFIFWPLLGFGDYEYEGGGSGSGGEADAAAV